MSQLQEYRSRALAAVKEQRETVRMGVNAIEAGVGAFGGGYLDVQYPDGIGGVPVSAGIALLALGAGFGMRQKDLIALGFGAGLGYLRALGEQTGVENPMTDAAATLRVVK